MPTSILDDIPAGLLLLGLALVLLAASQLGRWLGRRSRSEPDATEHTNVLLGALLALLGLMLAFSFSIVEDRYQERKHLALREANAIGTAWLRAGLFETPDGAHLRELLRAYVASRAPRSGEDFEVALTASETLHPEMWAAVTRIAREEPRPEITWLLVESVNELIDLHEERVAVGQYFRLQKPILWTMVLVATLSLLVQGFSAGQGRSRSFVASLALIVAVSVVMWLILELDEPWQRLAEINQQALVDVQETMSRGVAPGP